MKALNSNLILLIQIRNDCVNRWCPSLNSNLILLIHRAGVGRVLDGVTLNSNLILLILLKLCAEIDKKENFKFQSDSINTKSQEAAISALHDFKFQSDSINTEAGGTNYAVCEKPLNSNLILLIPH